MRVEAVSILRLRSLANVQLEDCGNFNVLIGKNNSGKSSVLSAIDAFFKCCGTLEVVATSVPFRHEIDFYEQVLEPIEICLTLSLEENERDAIVNDVVREAPQMKNAAGDLAKALYLRAILTITPPRPCFGYFSSFALCDSLEEGAKTYSLLDLSRQAALQIRENLLAERRARDKSEQIERFLSRVSAQEFQAFRRDEGSRFPLRYLMESGGPVDREIYERLETILRGTKNYVEFRTAAQELINTSNEEAAAARLKPLGQKVGTFSGDQVSIPDYLRRLIGRLANIKVLYLRERRDPIGKTEAARLLDLKNQRGGTRRFKHIQEAVISLLGVSIDVFKGDSSARNPDTEAEIDVDNFLAEVNGTGVREALRIILDVEFESPAILLVEEPEIYLHPSLEVSMMKYLGRLSASCQIFISTHSTNFIDSGDIENVYLVSKARSNGHAAETNVQSLDLREAEDLIPRELGIRLSSVFMFDRLVFVEGDSDENIIREWSSILEINLSSANVGFIPMEGARNLAHFAAASTLSFLTKRRVKMWFLIDRDEKDEAEIKTLADKFGDRASLVVLSKREIENYLLVPRAIAEFIGNKRLMSGGQLASVKVPLTEDAVKESLAQHAEVLKQFALTKRVSKSMCRPVFSDVRRIFEEDGRHASPERVEQELTSMTKELDDRKGTLKTAVEREKELLEQRWSSDKLDLVPGDILLDRVCRDFGVRYKKEKDAGRLATLMKDHEISSEIVAVIREIGEGGL
jgi:putative ATP-dependent endonuclease of the OLD family